MAYRRKKLDHFLTPYRRLNPKGMKDLNVRQETIKILEENTGNNLTDLSLSNFTRHIARGKGNKSKHELLGPHQHKKLLHREGNNQN